MGLPHIMRGARGVPEPDWLHTCRHTLLQVSCMPTVCLHQAQLQPTRLAAGWLHSPPCFIQ